MISSSAAAQQQQLQELTILATYVLCLHGALHWMVSLKATFTWKVVRLQLWVAGDVRVCVLSTRLYMYRYLTVEHNFSVKA